MNINQEYQEEEENYMKNEDLNQKFQQKFAFEQPEIQHQKDLKNQQRKQNEEMENFHVIGGTIFYTEIQLRKIVHGITGINLTQMNFDKSEILKELLEKSYDADYKLLLGELQYAFISFLMGEQFDSFEQWKKILILITSCEKAIMDSPQVFIDFIPVIYSQMKQFPRDFFIDAISGNSFLKSCLLNFFDMIFDVKVSNKLKSRVKKLQQMLKDKFEFDTFITDENYFNINQDPEDAPVIVEDFNFTKFD